MDSVPQCPAHIPIVLDELAARAFTLCEACQHSFTPTMALIIPHQPDRDLILYTRGKGWTLGEQFAEYEWDALGVLTDEVPPLPGEQPSAPSLIWTDETTPLPRGWKVVHLWEVRLHLSDSPLYVLGRYWPGCDRQQVNFGGLEQTHARRDYARLPALLAVFNALPPIVRKPPVRETGASLLSDPTLFMAAVHRAVRKLDEQPAPLTAINVATEMSISDRHLLRCVEAHTGCRKWRVFRDSLPRRVALGGHRRPY